MTARVRLQINGKEIDRTYNGDSSDDIVTSMQKDVAAESPWIIRVALNRMSPIQFAREAVKKYNASCKTDHRSPNTCDEFLETGVSMGIVFISKGN